MSDQMKKTVCPICNSWHSRKVKGTDRLAKTCSEKCAKEAKSNQLYRYINPGK